MEYRETKGLESKDFIKKEEQSVLRNPLIADALYRTKDIEKWGSGLKRIRKNPRITQKELMTEAGLGRRGIEWNISKLKKEGKLKRIGPDKDGRWEVVG